MKFRDYIFLVKNGDTYYEAYMSESLLAELQDRSPCSLDKKIWLGVERKGVEISMGCGDYLVKVLGRG